MMFELLKQQMSNSLRTWRGIGRRIYKDLKIEETEEDIFKQTQEEFSKAVKIGDVDQTTKNFEKLIASLEKLFDTDFDIQNRDMLFMHEMGSALDAEVKYIDEIESSILKNNKINDQTKKDLIRRIRALLEAFKQMHKQELDQIYQMIKQATDEAWDFERLRDQMYKNFQDYKTKGFARYFKWHASTGIKTSEKVIDQEKHLTKLIRSADGPEKVREIEQALSKLEKETAEEIKEFKNLSYAMRQIFQFAVFKHFTHRHLLSEICKKQDISILNQEGFPKDKMEDLIKKVNALEERVHNKAAELKQALKRVYQLNS